MPPQVPDMSLWRSTFLNNSAGGLGPGWTFNNPSFGSNGGVLDEGKSYGGAVYAPSSWLLITGKRPCLDLRGVYWAACILATRVHL
jgi:hypothetical protein